NPSVSPDGKFIAYTSASHGSGNEKTFCNCNSQEVWVMDSDGQNTRKMAADFEAEYGAATWSPDAKKIAYVKFKYRPGTMGGDGQIEVASVQDGGRSQVALSNPNLGPGLAWSGDGWLTYSLQERPPSQGDYNLWSARINERTGQFERAPVRMTSDAGGIRRLSLSSDGKRLAFLRETLQRDVYITNIEEHGTRLSTPRLLTLDERQDFPYDWTPDSKAVLFASDRDGAYHIFRQAIDRPSAELVVGGNKDVIGSRLSPDQRWIVYLELPNIEKTSITSKLMRIPLNGGPPQLILQAPGIHNQQCARAGSNLCLFAEFLPSGVKLFRFDPTTGDSKEIALPKIPGEEHFPYNWS